jgi:hypothetical protein
MVEEKDDNSTGVDKGSAPNSTLPDLETTLDQAVQAAGTEKPTEIPTLHSDSTPEATTETQSQAPSAKRQIFKNKWFLIASSLVIAAVLVGGFLATLSKNHKTANDAVQNTATGDYSPVSIPLTDLTAQQAKSLSVDGSAQLTVNGQLLVNGGIVITASSQPSNAVAGQLYFNRLAGKLYFYNGKSFIDITANATSQQSATGVTSVQGQTGPVSFTSGNGIVVNGTTISSSGVLSLSSSSPNLVISNNGNGSYSIADTSAGTSVLLQATSPGLAQTGNINLTGTIIAGNFSGDGSGLTGLNAASISTGTLSDARLSTNVTLQGNTFNGASQLVQLTAGGLVPVLNGSNLTNLNASNLASGTVADARLSSNVTLQGNTFNGASQLLQLSGASELPAVSGINLTNLNASSISAGTINDLRLSPNVTLQGNTFNLANKLVQLDGTGALPVLSGANLTSLNASNLASGTVGDVRLSANVALLNAVSNTFTGTVVVDTIQPTTALIIGQTTKALTLQGNASTKLTATTSGNTTTVGFTGVPTGAVNYNFDRATTPGTYTICSTVGNCASSGGGVTTLGGSTNKLSKFTGSQSIGDSSITDTGTAVTVAASGLFQAGSNSTAAFQVQNSAGTSNLFIADTTNTRIAIGQASATYTLDVNGDINAATNLRVGGNVVCGVGGCSASGGSGFYIQNGVSLQTSTNFNVQSNSSVNVVGIVKGAIGQTADLFQAQNSGGTPVVKLTNSGNVDITGNYLIGGTQISSANLSNDANLAKLNGTGPQTFTGNNKFTGTIVQQNAANSTSAFQIQNSAGTSNLFVADTTNTRIAIGQASAGYTLDVNGDINVASGSIFRVNGVAVCGPTATCAPSAGSANYVQNSTSLQTNANFNIQSVSSSSVVGIVKGAIGQTADLFRLQDGNGNNVATFANTGALTLGKNGTVTGTVAFINTSGTGSITLTPATLAASSFTLTLPAETGILCSTGSVCSGYAASAGSGGYIQNQNASAQTTANFWISGTGRADTGLQAPSLDTSGASALTIGGTNATSVTVGRSAAGGSTTLQAGSQGYLVLSYSSGTQLMCGLTGSSCLLATSTFFGTSGSMTIQSGATTSTTSGAISIISGNATSSTAGNVTVDTGTSASGTPTVNIGTANAKAIQIGNNTSNPSVTIAAGASGVLVQGATSANAFNVKTSLSQNNPGQATIGVASGPTASDFNMGYRFTANANGNVTQLWARCGAGTATARLYNGAGTDLTPGGSGYAITCAGISTWVSASITPIALTSGSQYYVSVRSSSWATTNPYTFPTTIGNITINDGWYISVSNSVPNTSSGSSMYGQPDITFVPTIATSLFNVDTSGNNVTIANGGLAGTIQIGNTTGAVTQTINIGNLNAAGTTNVVIGTGSSATAGNTTISARSTLALGNSTTLAITIQGNTSASLQIGNTNSNAVILGNTSGANTISGSSGSSSIAFGNFSVSTAGAIVGVGVNSGSGLIQGTGGLTLTGATSINTSGSAATSIGSGSYSGTVLLGNASATNTIAGNASSSITFTNFGVSAAGVITLLGGQSAGDITTAAATNATAIKIQAGASTQVSGTAAGVTIQGGNGTSGTTTGGTVTIKGGSGDTGGNVVVDGGVGPTAFGTVSIGAANALTTTLGRLGGATTIAGNTSSSIAFGNFTVSTAGAIVGVGVNAGSGLLQGTGGLTLNGATSINSSNGFATNIGNGSYFGTILLGNSGATNTIIGNLNSSINFTNFAVSSAGVITLQGNQTTDIMTAGAATANPLTFQPGISSAATGTGATATIQGGNQSGTTTANGGTLALKGGNATGVSGTRNGGNVTLDAGTGATANGSISIGTANAAGITIGNAIGTAAVSVLCGTGACGFGDNATGHSTAVGSASSTSATTIQSGTGNLLLQTQGTGTLGIGSNPVAQTLQIGNTTGATAVTIQAGSGNVKIQNTSGVTVLGVDTSTSKIISSLADGASAVGFTLNTTVTYATNGALLLSVQNNGTQKFAIDKNGHIITGGSGTTATVGANAGTTATCTVSGNDTSGTITLASAGTGQATGLQCTINLSTFAAAPHPVVSGVNANGASVQAYAGSTTIIITLNFGIAPSAGQTYTFNYFNPQ